MKKATRTRADSAAAAVNKQSESLAQDLLSNAEAVQTLALEIAQSPDTHRRDCMLILRWHVANLAKAGQCLDAHLGGRAETASPRPPGMEADEKDVSPLEPMWEMESRIWHAQGVIRLLADSLIARLESTENEANSYAAAGIMTLAGEGADFLQAAFDKAWAEYRSLVERLGAK